MKEAGFLEHSPVILKADDIVYRAGSLPVRKGIIDTENEGNDDHHQKGDQRREQEQKFCQLPLLSAGHGIPPVVLMNGQLLCCPDC